LLLVALLPLALLSVALLTLIVLTLTMLTLRVFFLVHEDTSSANVANEMPIAGTGSLPEYLSN
jgi:hypothetical protein